MNDTKPQTGHVYPYVIYHANEYGDTYKGHCYYDGEAFYKCNLRGGGINTDYPVARKQHFNASQKKVIISNRPDNDQ